MNGFTDISCVNNLFLVVTWNGQTKLSSLWVNGVHGHFMIVKLISSRYSNVPYTQEDGVFTKFIHFYSDLLRYLIILKSACHQESIIRL